MTPCEVIRADRKNQLNCGCYRTNDGWMWTRNPGPETKMLQGATEADLLSSPKAQELEEPGSPEHPEVEGRLSFEGMTISLRNNWSTRALFTVGTDKMRPSPP